MVIFSLISLPRACAAAVVRARPSGRHPLAHIDPAVEAVRCRVISAAWCGVPAQFTFRCAPPPHVCLPASNKILTAQNKLGMNALHEVAALSRAPMSRLNPRPYFDIIQHLCRPSRSFVEACLQRDTSGKTPLHLACELPTKGVLHAMLAAVLQQAPDHSLWSCDTTFPRSDLQDEVRAFIGAETLLQASRCVACQTTLRGCWCCTRCKNCLQGRPCVDDSR